MARIDGWGTTAAPAELGAPTGDPIRLAPVPLRHAAGAIVVVILGLLIAGIGAFALTESDGQLPGIICLSIGGLLLTGGIVSMAKRKGSCTLQTFDHGIAVDRSGKLTPIHFAELRALSVQEKEVLSNGAPTGILVTLLFEAQRGKMKLQNYFDFGPEGAAEFGACVDRIVAGRVEVMRQTVAEGRRIKGDGWSLDRDGLLGKDGRITDLTSVVLCRMSGDRVKLWRAAEEQPFVDTPAGSPDAQALAALVQPHLPEEPPEVDLPGSLGRILFTRKAKRTVTFLFGAVGLGAVLLGGVFLLAGDYSLSWIAAGGLLSLLLALRGLRFRLDVCSQGIRSTGLFSRRELRYAEVAALTHTATRQYVNGAYAGTTHVLVFEPQPGAGKRISYSSQSQGTDQELEAFRDRVAAIVADRLHAEVERAARVTWTPDVVLTTGGVEYRESKLIGKGEQCFLPFSDALTYQFVQGELHLNGDGSQPVARIPCGGPNFYPGFFLFLRLAAAPAG